VCGCLLIQLEIDYPLSLFFFSLSSRFISPLSVFLSHFFHFSSHVFSSLISPKFLRFLLSSLSSSPFLISSILFYSYPLDSILFYSILFFPILFCTLRSSINDWSPAGIALMGKEKERLNRENVRKRNRV
jgi:hypothetical protein